jgi:hypothetical protein
MAADHEDGDVSELLDYEEEETEAPNAGTVAVKDQKKDVKGAYVSIHSSGFRDFLLKPELLRAILDCGFEHPSEGILYSMSLVFLSVEVVYHLQSSSLTKGGEGVGGVPLRLT